MSHMELWKGEGATREIIEMGSNMCCHSGDSVKSVGLTLPSPSQGPDA